MKKHLLLLFAALLPMLASAQTKVEIDGIWYNLVSKAKQAEVTYKGDSYYSYEDEYSGSITIPESVTYNDVEYSVTSIGDRAFCECRSLTAITLPEGVTSIGSNAFYYCSSLTAITIPEGVTSIGSSAFSCCRSLTAITIPASVTSIGDFAFCDCSSLTAITIPEGVTSIVLGAFMGCSSLTAINIPEGVTSIGVNAFYGCSSLTAINIPEGVKYISSEAFANCSELTDVYCNAETVPSTNANAFNGSYIEYATLHVPASALNDYKTTAPWSSFGKFETLATLVEGITLSQSSATLLVGASLTLTATVTPDDATDKSITWSSSNPSVATVDNTGKVTAIATGTATITATANDGSGVSASCEASVTSTAKVQIEGIWYNLTSETQQAGVTFKGSSPDEYSNEYSGPINLPATVTYEGVDYSVTSIGNYAFSGCSSLTTITIPEGVTSINWEAFSGCSSLTAITIPENSQLTSIGGNAFNGCSSLTAITIPEGVTSIGYGAFENCSSLTAITIPEGVTNIEEYAFYECFSLTAINIPESVTSIEYAAFSGCSSLTAINIPEGVTSIAWETFSGCSSLTTVVLPKSLENIDYEAFANCSELLDVYCYAEEVPSTEADAFDGSYPENVTLHVPASALNAYKSTAPWNSFGKFETIETLVEGITLSQSSATLTEGGTLTLTATVTPDDATNKAVTWSSSNTSVATVDANGKVTAKAAGTATITATANDGSGVKASCVVTVEKKVVAVSSITLSQSLATLIEGGTLTLTATVTPDDATNKAVTWSSSNTSVATVDANGKVTAKAAGTATITATANDGSGAKASCVVTVEKKVVAVSSITLSQTSAILTEGETLSLTATVTPDDATNKGITWSNSNTSVATVDANGKVTAIAPGTATITATANDDSGAKASCVVTVVAAEYTITYYVDGEIYHQETLTRGTAIVPIEVPTKEGHTFSGWSEIPETMPANDITVSGTFTVNKYHITFEIGNEVIASYYLEYGTEIVAPEAPEKEGHTFAGWGGVDTTVPAHDVTFWGSYILNSYYIYYYVGEDLVHTIELFYGETIPEYIYEPTTEGDVFMGWIGDTYDTMPAHDVTYTANIANGIENSEINTLNSEFIYDLSGRKVTDMENLRGGIYIVNGKKVIVK